MLVVVPPRNSKRGRRCQKSVAVVVVVRGIISLGGRGGGLVFERRLEAESALDEEY